MGWVVATYTCVAAAAAAAAWGGAARRYSLYTSAWAGTIPAKEPLTARCETGESPWACDDGEWWLPGTCVRPRV